MKYILIIGDGMADNPIEKLNKKTPLQAVNKPSIDSLARKGIVGSALTVPIGMPPGSDTAILSIFGYNPKIFFSGRSPLEAAGSGIKLNLGNVCYRCNLTALSGDAGTNFVSRRMLSHSAGSIEPENAIALMGVLISNAEFKAAAAELGMKFEVNPSFRHLAVQRSADNEGLVTTPPHDIVGQEIADHLPKGCLNAEKLKALMMLSNRILENNPINIEKRKNGKLPANSIWFWAEGSDIQLPSFRDKYGKTGSVISAVPLVWGIASLAGLKPVHVEGATGVLDTNYEGKVEALINCLKNGDDFAAIHIEAPDECSHDGNLEEKLEAISRLDSRVVAPIIEKCKNEGVDFRLLIISDHKTLISTRTHDGDPVPYLIYDSRKDSGENLPYDEGSAKDNHYIADGSELMSVLFSK